MFGSLVCTATKFDKREEWDVSTLQVLVYYVEVQADCIDDAFRLMEMTGRALL